MLYRCYGTLDHLVSLLTLSQMIKQSLRWYWVMQWLPFERQQEGNCAEVFTIHHQSLLLQIETYLVVSHELLWINQNNRVSDKTFSSGDYEGWQKYRLQLKVPTKVQSFIMHLRQLSIPQLTVGSRKTQLNSIEWPLGHINTRFT